MSRDIVPNRLHHFVNLGTPLTTHQVYFEYEHMASTPFIKKNYKQVLYDLYSERKLTASRKPQRPGTFADDIAVAFPALKH